MWKQIQSFFSFQADCCIGCFAEAKSLFISVRFFPCDGREMQSTVIFLDVPEGSEDYFAEIAAQIKLYCIREGLKRPGIIFCLTERDVFQYQKVFPSMRLKEIEEAVRWDAEANVPFKEGTYDWGYICLGQNKILIGAAENILLKSLQSAFLEEELFLCGISLEPDENLLHTVYMDVKPVEVMDIVFSTEEREGAPPEHGALIASWAAVKLLQREAYLNLLVNAGKPYRLLWKRIIWTGMIGCVMALCLIYFCNSWKLQNLEKQGKQNEYQISLLRKDLENKQEAEDLLQRSQNKNKILLELSQEKFSWYGILIHLGTLTVDNVWVTELSLQQEKMILIRGRAIAYENLAGFMKQFEGKITIFSEKPVLQNASMDKDGRIDFSILLHLKE